jgi:hypothetical protein
MLAFVARGIVAEPPSKREARSEGDGADSPTRASKCCAKRKHAAAKRLAQKLKIRTHLHFDDFSHHFFARADLRQFYEQRPIVESAHIFVMAAADFFL